MTHSLNTLSAICEWLKSEQYDANYFQEEGAIIPERVVLPLGKTSSGLDLLLHIAHTGQTTKKFTQSLPETELPPCDFVSLQFNVVIPQLVQDEAKKELMSYLLSLNAYLDMAHFCYYEAEKIIFYRYVYLAPLSGISESVLVAIIESIRFLLDLFTQPITDVAKGVKTCKELQDEAKKMMQDIEFSTLK